MASVAKAHISTFYNNCMLLRFYPPFIWREQFPPKLSRPFPPPAINPTHLRIPCPPPPISRRRSSLLHSPPIPKTPMAANGERHSGGSPGFEEPSPKLPRLSLGIEPHSNAPLLKVKKLSEHAVLPSRASPLSAGYDLSSAVETKVPARGKALVPTDLSIAIPEGTYARVAPRSGLAWKHSIDVGAGVIDADYRGPVGVVLFNHSDVDFEVKQGERIAQLIIERIMTPDVAEVDDLDSTVRGAGGFGSTGV